MAGSTSRHDSRGSQGVLVLIFWIDHIYKRTHSTHFRDWPIRAQSVHPVVVSLLSLSFSLSLLQLQQQHGAGFSALVKEIMAHQEFGKPGKGMDGRTAKGGRGVQDQGIGTANPTGTGARGIGVFDGTKQQEQT